MPTYEYECGACGHAFEKIQSMKDKPVRKCPECGKLKSRRLISAGAGVIFKGNGFYETDYRSESYRKEQKKEKEAASSSSEGKAEKKEENKTTKEISASEKNS